MRYMLLIHYDEHAFAGRSPEKAAEMVGAYREYTEALTKSGKLVQSDRLQAASTAKIVRIEGGHRGVSDGPYADVKEALGGFYLIEAANEAEAVEWAAKCPGASSGAVEVRAVFAR